MANQIRVTPDELRNTANTLRKCARSFQEGLEDTNKAIEKVNLAWSGDAMNKYYEIIQSKANDTNVLADILLSLAAALEEAATSFEQTESQIASLIRF